MRSRGMRIKHAKVRGEWAELKFMLRAMELGLHLSKPWGEVVQYDFIVENDGRFVRVQVKSTMFQDRGGYSCTVRGSAGPYEGDPFEYLAAYVLQEDVWYIIPAELVVGQGSIALYPKLKRAKYEAYREAWHLLRGSRVDRIMACVEDGADFEAVELEQGFADSSLPPVRGPIHPDRRTHSTPPRSSGRSGQAHEGGCPYITEDGDGETPE
jgi:hypothetical protein